MDNNINSFREPQRDINKICKDDLINISESQIVSSPINDNDNNTTIQTQSSDLSSYVHMLSPLQNSKFEERLPSGRTPTKKYKDNRYAVLISNPSISSKIKTKINTLIVENSKLFPQFRSLLYQNTSCIDTLIHKRKTNNQKNEILNMLNTPVKPTKDERFYSRNKTAQIQKKFNNFFLDHGTNLAVKKPLINTKKTEKILNKIKKKEDDLDVFLFKNQFETNSGVKHHYVKSNFQNYSIKTKSAKQLLFHKKTFSSF